MTQAHLSILRHGGGLTLFDRKEKQFTRIQPNKKQAFVCWERWVSKDRRNWVNWNLCLSLKDVNKVLADLKSNNTQ